MSLTGNILESRGMPAPRATGMPPHAAPLSLLPDGLTFAAVAMAALAVELAHLALRPLAMAGIVAMNLLIAAVVLRVLLGWLARRWPATAQRLPGAIALAAVGGPAVYWALSPMWTLDELLVLMGRNAALAGMAVSVVGQAASERYRPLAMAVSVFVVLACSVSTDHYLGGALVAAFALVGCAWLAQRALSGGASGGGSRAGGVSWAAVTASGIVAVGAAAAAWGVHGQPGVVLGRVLPAWIFASGGDAAGHDRARHGIGDGPDQIAGASADSTGFDNSDFFSECHGDCLYDAIVETYGTPQRRREIERQQMLSVDQQAMAADHLRRDMRDGRDRPGRLSLRRTRPEGGRADLPAAVMWIDAGDDQLPLHLPMIAFDRFDGVEWHEAQRPAIHSAIDNADTAGWFVPADHPSGGAWGISRSVTIRTGEYDANILPFPTGLTRFRMGRLERADLFASAHEPMLRMNRRRLPEGSVIEARYRPVNRASMGGVALASITGGAADAEGPAAALAREWAGDLPRGWEQVQAVVEGLREFGQHERRTAPGEEEDVLEWFLRERAGEAYHFATAAVVMLRSLGYDARLASGFYVDGARRDEASGRIVVRHRDAHVWAQVRLEAPAGPFANGSRPEGMSRGWQWVDIEPTPGFGVADGAPALGQRLMQARNGAWEWLLGNVVAVVVVFVVAGVMWSGRRLVADGAGWLLWRAALARRDERGRVLATVRLLEGRARRRRAVRQRSTSPARWAAQADEEFGRLVNWASHAPRRCPAPAASIDTACRRAVASCSVLLRP